MSKRLCHKVAPNGLRYPLVGGTRQRHFDGTSFEPNKLPENEQTPTSRVHAVLDRFYFLEAVSELLCSCFAMSLSVA